MTRWRWAAAAVIAVGAMVVGGLLALDAWRDRRQVEPPPVFAEGDGPSYFPSDRPFGDAMLDPTFDPVGAAEVVEPGLEAPTYTWKPRPVGGGGWVKGLEVHRSGAVEIARTDVGGAYRFDRSTERWEQLILASTVTERDVGDYFVESVAISPSDPDRIHLSVGISNNEIGERRGRVLSSDDGGRSWTPSAQPFQIHGNGDDRFGGERLVVHPTDPDEVWLGTTAGLWRSIDGGVTYAEVVSAPAGDQSLVDKSGVEWVEVREDVTYIGVAGSGVHRSLDSGATWEQLWAATGRPFDAETDDAGVLWVSDWGAQELRRYDPTTGVAELIDGPTGTDIRGLAVSPDGETVIVLTGGREVWRTTDGGGDWSRVDVGFSCPDIPWLDAYDTTLFTASSPEFDPVDPQRMWLPEGFGVWSATDVFADRIDFVCRTTGIEELVVNDIAVPRSDEVVIASWDRAVFHLPAGGQSAGTIGPTDRFNSGWDLATTPADPDVIGLVVGDHRFCCEGDGQAYRSARSRDGGLTWETFGSHDGDHPDELRFGNLAISATDPDTMVWLPTWDGALHRTVDGGTSWERIVLPGTEGERNEEGRYVGGSHFQYYLQREVLVADPVDGDRFYLFHADLGFHRSDDGGSTWELVSVDGLPTGWTVGYFNAQLVAVPGSAGHLLYTPGELVEGLFPMFESTDAGETWAPVEGTEGIVAMGFGAPLEGDDPALYLAGTIDGEAGIWRSPDLGRSWEFVDETPGGIYQTITAVAGDPGIPGRVYVGFAGVGVMQGDPGS